MTEPMRAAPIVLGLTATFVLGLGLRVQGLDRLQPHLQESDPYLVLQMQLHRAGIEPGRKLPHGYYAYPTLIARALAWIPEARVDPATPPDERLAAELAAASADVVRVRTLVALLASLLIPATFALGRRFLSPGAALLASALTATSLLHLLFSQEARPHGAHATCAALAVLAALWMRRHPSWGAYAAGAAAAALALGTLHTGVFVVPPLIVAHLLRDRERRNWVSHRAVLVPLAAAAFAIGMLYPRAPTVQPGGVWEFGGHTLRLASLDGSGFARLATFLWDCDPALFVLAAGGLVAALARLGRGAARIAPERRGDLLVVLSYAVPYFLALGLFGEVQDRFLLPLIPYLAVLGGLLFETLTPRAGQQRAVVATLLAVLALSFPAHVVWRFAQVRAAPDTVERAAAWVRTNARPNADRVLVTPRLALPLFHDPESLRLAAGDYASRQSVWIAWQLQHRSLQATPKEPEPAWKLFLTPGKLVQTGREHDPEELRAWLDEVHPRYAVLEVSRLTMFLPEVRALRDLIRERGTVRAHLHGEGTEWCQEPPLDYQDVPHLARRILAAEAFGPCIEIYRLDD